MKRGSIKRSKWDELKGWRFFLVSTATASLCLMFLFAVHLIFPKIKEEVAAALKLATHRVTEWGGGRVETLEVTVSGEAKPLFLDERRAELLQQLADRRGQPLWSIDLSDLKAQVLGLGWVESVYIRRAVPSTLKVHVVSRVPRLWVQSREWWLCDQNGVFMLKSDHVPGHLSDIPFLNGLRSLSEFRDVATANRSLVQEQSLIAEVVEMSDRLTKQVGLPIVSIRVQPETWSDEWLVSFESQAGHEIVLQTGAWSDRLTHLQYVLSDLQGKPSKILGQYEGQWIVRPEVK